MKDLFSVKNKVALVTGGSRGIGEMISAGFLANGSKVYISSRKAEVCDATAKRLSEEYQSECISLPSDLSNLEGIESLVNQLKQKEGSLDILINNAGAAWGAPLEEYPENGWDKVMDTNVKGVFFLTQKLLPMLKEGAKKGPSRVVNIGSIDGLTRGSFENYAYGPSKAALHHLTRVLAKELAKDNINVNTISPGPFPSKMTDFMVGEETFLDYAGNSTPLGRSGKEEDMIATSLFLSGKGSAYITGALIPLDGGVTLGR